MTEERKKFETDNDTIDWAVTYQNTEHILYLSSSIAVFGAEIFKSARLVQDVKHLEAIHDHHEKGITMPETMVRVIAPYLFNWLADEVLIVTGFENAMKADLMNRGYVVHEFASTAKGKVLKSEQQAAPLLASRMLAEQVTMNDLKRKTITMSKMLEPSYTQVIGMPQNVVDILRKFNKRRNNLHLIMEMNGELGNGDIVELKTLDAIIDRLVEHFKHEDQRGR